MSVRVMALVWELSLPPMEKLVLLALADCANDEGTCWPSATTLARKTGQGERTVRRAIGSLVSLGHLKQIQRTGTSPIYTVNPCQSGTPASQAPLPERHPTPASQAPKPSRTINGSEAKASSPRKRKAFDAPDGVSGEQWDAFCQQRRKALNDRSYLLLSNRLRNFAEAGYPPGELIDLAIERGWETVFEPRKPANDRQPQSTGSRNQQAFIGAVGNDPNSAF